MKIHTINNFFWAAIIGLFGVAWATECRAAVNAAPQVVPAVRQWTGGEGVFDFGAGAIVVDEEYKTKLYAVAKALQDDLQLAGCCQYKIHTAAASSKSDLFITLAADSPYAKTHDKFAAEGYTLKIADRAVLTAATPVGIFYGTRTLLQLLAPLPQVPVPHLQGPPMPPPPRSLPRGMIVDFPQYRHRMFMLDVGRKPFPFPVLKDYLRVLAWYKMNELHLHLSDEAFGEKYAGFRLQCDTFPGLASKDCFYTKKELRELQDMAAGMGITITPEIDMPGHAKVFTNYWPDLALKGHPNYLDVTNPQTIVTLKKLLDEMIPIFDAPDFHIGTDEYRVGGPRQEELHEAFRKFINTMNAHIRSKGKNCRIWSGFENMKGHTEIDPSVIIDMWETRDAKGQIAKGHSIINSSDGRTYIVPGAHYYGVSNPGIYGGWEPWMVSGNPAMNPSKDDPKLLGGKLHVWCDQGPTGYTMNEIARLALPSIQVFAEKLWGTKGSKDYVEFQKRAERVQTVPGVTMFERAVLLNRDGVLVDLPKEMEFATGNFARYVDVSRYGTRYGGLNSKCDNLEYPWTMTVDVFKTADTDTRGVILSSDLAEICTDYTRQEDVTVKGADGKPKKTKVTRHGIGVIRAAGSPGADAASSHLVNNVSRVYSDPLPLNKWTKIAIVGQQRRTTVYVNGQKVGESGEQALCPVTFFGSQSGQSFVGKIRNVKVWARALTAKEIGRAAGLDVPDNLAAHCAVTASASDTPYGFTPENITDGDLGTRWSSGVTSAPQWVQIDLRKEVEFNAVSIAWEHARPNHLRIQVPEGDGWKDAAQVDVSGEHTEARFATLRAARVRLLMSDPATSWGYSIWEAEVLNYKK